MQRHLAFQLIRNKIQVIIYRKRQALGYFPCLPLILYDIY